ncbi:MAG: two pore domain potassium channel family protein [Candidatus Eisenbacteria sp.]|nr:two pore domain potassium channel family protein [Candidatus Eisenbacteria bacterium]
MQRIITMVAVLLLIVVIGSILYVVVERVSFLEAFYFTLTTLTTVGYGDLVPRSGPGHWVAMGLMVFGIGSGLLLTTLVTSFLVEGRLRALMGGRRMKRAIERMRDHYVVCGFGKLGRSVARLRALLQGVS